jgi:hypothetical protein
MKTLFTFILFTTITSTQAQNFKGLDKSPMDKTAYPMSYRVKEKVAVITYSRPTLRGRLFSEIVPFGKVWRTGANEATELHVLKSIEINDIEIRPGIYTLYTIFEANQMTLIVNNTSSSWGSYSYSEKKDLLRYNVPIIRSNESLEAFSMIFSKKDEDPKIHIGWGKIRASIPFTIN